MKPSKVTLNHIPAKKWVVQVLILSLDQKLQDDRKLVLELVLNHANIVLNSCYSTATGYLRNHSNSLLNVWNETWIVDKLVWDSNLS